MKIFFILIISCIPMFSGAQSEAFDRAERMGWGMNLSWLENWWLGTAENGYADYLDLSTLPSRKRDIELIKEMGFQTVRLPIIFDLWEDGIAPYQIDRVEYFEASDSLINWCLAKDVNVIIDYQYGSLFSNNYEEEVLRIMDLWREIALRYKDTNPERVFFEIYNEPNDFPADIWMQLANDIVAEIRSVAPHHSIIVGGVDWNSVGGLQAIKPLDDDNIIYTFHFYEPMLFTHQGADWMILDDGNPVATTGIPFPYNPLTMPNIDVAVGDSWGKYAFEDYNFEGTFQFLEQEIGKAKDWSVENEVPIFCGEWGTFEAAEWEDRWRHSKAVLYILDSLSIPFCYWEWDREFKIFEGAPADQTMPDCMKEVWNQNHTVYPPDWQMETVKLYPNPTRNFVSIKQSEQKIYDKLFIYNGQGKLMDSKELNDFQTEINVSNLSNGIYFIQFTNNTEGIQETQKLVKY